jgi:uncharacterized protein (DUF1697 family)
MTTYVALLRAVNVGGTGKLPMTVLKAMCTELGFGRVETYIASGNVVFDSELSAQGVQARLAQRLQIYAGREIGVFVRTAARMHSILKKNPFHDRQPNLTYAFFLHDKPERGVLDRVRGRDAEEMGLGPCEIYVYYPKGMGQSKLQIPAANAGTARNLNTVAKLVALSLRK